jgi:leader peptidase (prepilin peptidase)/N-methyltransferase
VLLGWSHPVSGWAGWSQAVLLWGLLFPIAAIDLRSLLVDLRLVALGITLRLLSLLLWERAALLEMAAGLLIAAGFFQILELFYEVLRGRRGLGEGDAAVAGLVGAFVGWQGVLPLVALAALAGLAVGLPWLVASRRPLSTPIPFAPFLCAAGMAVYLAELHGWPGAWPLIPMP